jgi:hypothetical protein
LEIGGAGSRAKTSIKDDASLCGREKSNHHFITIFKVIVRERFVVLADKSFLYIPENDCVLYGDPRGVQELANKFPRGVDRMSS